MKNVFAFNEFRKFLTAILEERTAANPKYSLRSFAKDLGLSPSRLSEILSSRCGISTASALKIAENLGLKRAEIKFFMDLVVSECGKTADSRAEAIARVLELQEKRGFVADQKTSLLSKWYYSPLVEILTLTPRLEDDAIAKVLGISAIEVIQSRDFLHNEGFIERLETGEWKKCQPLLKFESPTPSQSIRNAHKAVLARAAEAIEEQAIKDRKYLSSFISVRKDTIESARKDLEDFTANFVKTYSSEQAADSVYCFSLQLFQIGSSTR